MTPYEKGLEKLGLLILCGLPCSHRVAIDLRKDPAFAWRVVEAMDIEQLHDVVIKSRCGVSRAAALYAAVCELGE